MTGTNPGQDGCIGIVERIGEMGMTIQSSQNSLIRSSYDRPFAIMRYAKTQQIRIRFIEPIREELQRLIMCCSHIAFNEIKMKQLRYIIIMGKQYVILSEPIVAFIIQRMPAIYISHLTRPLEQR